MPAPEVYSLIARAEAYAEAAGLSLTTVSLRLFNDGKRIEALKGGSRMWPETLDEAARRLARLESALTDSGAAA